jgi:hypothetical protein
MNLCTAEHEGIMPPVSTFQVARHESTTERTTVAANLSTFSSQPEKCAEPQIIALVELDMQKMRVRFALAPETIRERMQELEHPKEPLRGEAGH